MAQNDIGIDLGTTTIIIAQEGKGVVLNQPSVVAMDTRKNTVLEAGDKALAMVGRTPNYISAIFPLKDGVIRPHHDPRADLPLCQAGVQLPHGQASGGSVRARRYYRH